MSRYPSNDPYLDPARGVLRNRLGITDTATLESIEAAFAAIRSFELARVPIRGRFDVAHLQAIHRYLFGDVYDWAGELRTIDISKGGSHFAHHAHLESAAGAIFRQLAAENYLIGLSLTAFSERAAWLLGELNALHPFRDGNGRAQREFISQLAQAAGYYIAWENVSPADMLAGSVASFHGDGSKLATLIRKNLSADPG